jgi:hypothetical protein
MPPWPTIANSVADVFLPFGPRLVVCLVVIASGDFFAVGKMDDDDSYH